MLSTDAAGLVSPRQKFGRRIGRYLPGSVGDQSLIGEVFS